MLNVPTTPLPFLGNISNTLARMEFDTRCYPYTFAGTRHQQQPSAVVVSSSSWSLSSRAAATQEADFRRLPKRISCIASFLGWSQRREIFTESYHQIITYPLSQRFEFCSRSWFLCGFLYLYKYITYIHMYICVCVHVCLCVSKCSQLRAPSASKEQISQLSVPGQSSSPSGTCKCKPVESAGHWRSAIIAKASTACCLLETSWWLQLWCLMLTGHHPFFDQGLSHLNQQFSTTNGWEWFIFRAYWYNFICIHLCIYI